MEIIPGVYQQKNAIVNWYLIVEDQNITMVDAGVRSTYRQVTNLIHSLGRRVTDLSRILLTHADLDHVGAAQALKQASGAKVFASQIAAQALAAGHSSRTLKMGILTPLFSRVERLNGSMQVEVDEILSDGQILPVLGGLKVIKTPGHTPCHLSYFSLEYQLLFAGDAVRNQPDAVGYNQSKLTNWDHQVMRQSVKMLADLRPEIVACGHGPVVFNAREKFPQS
ncbi:MAG: MBL fold metallo-hydrolase [Anaerolineales bacterium]|nr:MBL fold metallo-hydrolase [Anaerolineales bacterium]